MIVMYTVYWFTDYAKGKFEIDNLTDLPKKLRNIINLYVDEEVELKIKKRG